MSAPANCPKCGSNSQVWVNLLSDKLTCHRIGCHVEVPSPGDVSDGYHTFNELYEHRHALFLALINCTSASSWMSKLHDDGTSMEGWFIAGVKTPCGMVSYHLPDRLWDAAFKAGAFKVDRAPKWDGHTAADVVNRLMAWATE